MSHTESFLLPDLGEGVAEGEVVLWLKKPGDAVKKDEPVIAIMTDKATVELPSPFAGTLAKQYYKVGEIATKGKPLFDIETASPAARRIAKEQVAPTTLGKPLIGLPRLMAEKMSEAHATAPPFSYFDKADATRLIHLQEHLKEKASQRNLKLTYMPLFIRALSLALREHPLINSSLINNILTIHPQHNIGIAMQLKEGLAVPVLKNVEKMSLEEITIAYEEIKTRAKANLLKPSDMKESTITISNFGAFGATGFATPILNTPNAAILAIAKIHKEPVVINDTLAIKDTLALSWTFDHRIIDGGLGITFSRTFVSLLENPAPLL